MRKKANRLMLLYSLLKKGAVSFDSVKKEFEEPGKIFSRTLFLKDIRSLKELLPGRERLQEISGQGIETSWVLHTDSPKVFNAKDFIRFSFWKNFAPVLLAPTDHEMLKKLAGLIMTNMELDEPNPEKGFSGWPVRNSHFGDNSTYSRNSLDFIQKFTEAIEARKVMRVHKGQTDYTSLPASIKFPLDFCPVNLLFHRGTLHVCGFQYQAAENHLLILAVEELLSYEPAGMHFDIPGAETAVKQDLDRRFGITANIDKEQYIIQLEFSQVTGAFIHSHFWHYSQQFSLNPAGNLILTLNCGINRELIGWIMMWMQNVRVLQPDKLRRLVIDQAGLIGNVNNDTSRLEYRNTLKPL